MLNCLSSMIQTMYFGFIYLCIAMCHSLVPEHFIEKLFSAVDVCFFELISTYLNEDNL